MRWLEAACVVVQVFGAFMVLSPNGVKALFGLMLFSDHAALEAHIAAPMGYIELLHAVLGAVLFGWGVAFFLLVRWFFTVDPIKVCRLFLIRSIRQ